MRSLLVLVAACSGAARPPSAPAAATRLPADAGEVVAIDEVGDATIVLDRERAFVVRGGALAASVPAPHGWRAGATIAALDGEGAWAVGVSDDGRLYRITLAGELEDITDRFAVADVRAVAAAGTTTAFALPDGVAVSGDGIHELRARTAPPDAVAASRGRVALLGAARRRRVGPRASSKRAPTRSRRTAIAFVGGAARGGDQHRRLRRGSRRVARAADPRRADRRRRRAAVDRRRRPVRARRHDAAPHDRRRAPRGAAVRVARRRCLPRDGRRGEPRVDRRDDRRPDAGAPASRRCSRACARTATCRAAMPASICPPPRAGAPITTSSCAASSSPTPCRPPVPTSSPADRDALARWLTSPPGRATSTSR